MEDRQPVGGFLTAVLENDLMQAFGQADQYNLAALKEILIYVRWEIPASCWGSPEKVQAHLYPESVQKRSDDYRRMRETLERVHEYFEFFHEDIEVAREVEALLEEVD